MVLISLKTVEHSADQLPGLGNQFPAIEEGKLELEGSLLNNSLLRLPEMVISFKVT